MNVLLRVMHAAGSALQVFADAVAVDVTIAPAKPAGKKAVGAANPYADEDTAEWLRDSLDNIVAATWTLYAVNELSDGVNASRDAAHAALQLFTDQSRDAERALFFELARLVHELLPAGTDPDSLPCMLRDPDADVDAAAQNLLNVTAEIAAFFDAALRCDFAAAVAVSDAARDRLTALTLDAFDDVETAEYQAVLAFAGLLLGNLSREWSLNTFDDLLADAVDGDDA